MSQALKQLSAGFLLGLTLVGTVFLLSQCSTNEGELSPSASTCSIQELKCNVF
jgi:hypothetical protein